MRQIDEFRRYFCLGQFLAVFSLESQRLHGHQVDYSLVIALQAHRYLKQHRIVVQLLMELPGNPEGVGAGPVAFVYKSDPGDVVAHHLPVNGNRLRLYAADGAKHQDGPIENPKGPFHFDGEIDVARRIDDVDG